VKAMKAVEGREILGCFLKFARSLKAAAMDCTYHQEGGPSYSSLKLPVCSLYIYRNATAEQ